MFSYVLVTLFAFSPVKWGHLVQNENNSLVAFQLQIDIDHCWLYDKLHSVPDCCHAFCGDNIAAQFNKEYRLMNYYVWDLPKWAEHGIDVMQCGLFATCKMNKMTCRSQYEWFVMQYAMVQHSIVTSVWHNHELIFVLEIKEHESQQWIVLVFK